MTEQTATISFEQVLIFWEEGEGKVEEKLEMLENAIFQHLGLMHDANFYEEKGKFLERFAAGFIHGYFNTLQDISFLLLDPVHIFDVLTTLVKNIFLHPLLTIKAMWGTWTYYYTHGAFGIGMMMSDIVLGTLLVVAGGLVAGEKLIGLLKNAAKVFEGGLTGNITYIPEKLLGMNNGVRSSMGLSKSVVKEALKAPHSLVGDVLKSLDMKDSFGKLREYRLYVADFLQKG